MTRYISDEHRLFISERAKARCEYCKMPEEHSFYAFHIDHIISIKHGGLTEIDNLAYTCFCNRNKGSDIASIYENTIIAFFNPRIDDWDTHFCFENAIIQPLTKRGFITSKILNFNHPDRISERKVLIMSKRYIFK